ncbi:MAG: hypothetical protein R3182_03695, partial [Draconibacterium sp.]|nr:hypothetical protein [Draconibacterium sp.]
KSLFNKEFNVIKLEEQSYGVGEVDVAAQNMVLIRILRMASENIKYNFGTGPFNLHCNYTNEIIVNSEKNVAVANVLIYDESGYSNPSKLDAYQKRKYTVTKEKGKDDYSFATGIINIDEILGFDLARSASSVLNPALLNEFQLSLADQPTLDGKEYWVISFSQVLPSLEGSGDFNASKFEGQITIKKEDYSVLKITGKVKSAKNNRQGRGLAVGDSNTNYFENVSYEFAVDYTNLLVNEIHLKKAYTYKQKSIEEQTVLKVNRAHANNLTKIDTRDYFQGE